jgi:lipid II:glycine glycyltransferase (peptidoglycan interpeptide bridge formation enzyme)
MREEWDSLTSRFRDLSYQQCGAYSEIAAQEMGATSEFLGIFQAEELIGLASVRVKTISFLPVGVAYIHYGPLTARRDDFAPGPFGHCLDALRKEYVDDRQLMLRVVPPLQGGQWLEAQSACLETRGFRSGARYKPRETFILDLGDPLPDIRTRFDSKWRNDLSKALRSNIKITRSTKLIDLDHFDNLFRDFVKSKGFIVRQDVAFFKRVQERAHEANQTIAHLAWYDDELIAGHIGSFVGDTAVYLLGAASPKGRELRASYLLQWTAIEYAKSTGNLSYDLGGIDQETNPDVYRFKKRLNGRRVVEIGPYELAPSQLTRHALHFLEEAYGLIRSRLKVFKQS